MAEGFLKSEVIKMYPSAYRGYDYSAPFDLEARLTIEKNLARFTNWTINKGFVITLNSDLTNVKFNIAGYFFDGDFSEYSSWSDVYAKITLKKDIDALVLDNQQINLTNLITSDDSNDRILDKTLPSDAIYRFYGLKLANTPFTVDNDLTFQLHIAHKKEDATWEIPSESRVIVDVTQVAVNNTNGESQGNLGDYVIVEENGSVNLENINNLIVSGTTTLGPNVTINGKPTVVYDNLGDGKVQLKSTDGATSLFPKTWINVSYTEASQSPLESEQVYNFSEGGGNTLSLSKVAKTGVYSDLQGVPAIPVLNTTSTASLPTNASEQISGTIRLHKISKTGSYNDLVDNPGPKYDIEVQGEVLVVTKHYN